MNIFYLDPDPETAALYHCDKHVVKMIVETAQMLSTVCHARVPGNWYFRNIYKPTHVGHPCTKWVGESAENFGWTLELLGHLLNQFDIRYGNVHRTGFVHDFFKQQLGEILPHLPDVPRTSPALAMPDQYKHSDPVQAYRAYYRAEKASFATWRIVGTPTWWTP